LRGLPFAHGLNAKTVEGGNEPTHTVVKGVGNERATNDKQDINFIYIDMKTRVLSFALLAAPMIATAGVRPEIAILGDSYSTFEGYIPEGNEIWYFAKNDIKTTDVSDVTETWWWQVCNDGGYKLGTNDSWSGATICYTGYNDEDYSPRSFNTRIPRLGHPDIILIFGATNDSWCDAPIGEYKYSNYCRADLFTFRPAMARLLQEASKHYPGTKIYFIINSELKDEIATSIETICRHEGVEFIRLHDIAKQNGHPNREGMKAIATQVLDKIGRQK